jgi:uncharacterized protein (DUF1778 family)
MPKKKQPKKVRIQLQLDTEIAKALKVEAARNLQTLTKFITEWVTSWKDKKK